MDFVQWSELCAPPYMQLAMYPKTGAKYVRHLDNDPLDEGNREGPVGLRVCDRVVTALLYFNKDWTPEDGGYLRLYRPELGREEEVLLEVAPAAGTLILFESERQVAPSSPHSPCASSAQAFRILFDISSKPY
jgi:Rps23 Pro-64 3,4-dihydroxylase Tpa1-like proline 4-hydroxylase